MSSTSMWCHSGGSCKAFLCVLCNFLTFRYIIHVMYTELSVNAAWSVYNLEVLKPASCSDANTLDICGTRLEEVQCT